MKKLFILGIMCFMALAINAQSFVDLGLPSGTKWKTQNQTGLYTYDDAISKFGNRLPTKDQWNELIIECVWEWTGSGYKVTGPNGNSIELPAEGRRFGSEPYVCDVGKFGCYWSSTRADASYGPNSSWYLHFDSSHECVRDESRGFGLSVRLVQNK